MSLTSRVPEAVPSVFHSSEPCTPSSAEKKTVDPTAARKPGSELPQSGGAAEQESFFLPATHLHRYPRIRSGTGDFPALGGCSRFSASWDAPHLAVSYAAERQRGLRAKLRSRPGQATDPGARTI